ncbi:FAD-binding protein [Flexibacterium corallicola]|uniref:FAD-binding protein n=1 Tax=Flexibacterium corallicola TaxID=3037259 RepID=UPI00286EF47C|nr:FAD-binding protein [Pseudovibrio sp. M1P-2-3]
MAENFKPTTQQELVDVVAWAAAEKKPLTVIGTGSKQEIGYSVQSAFTLTTQGLSGVVEYDPAELVLTAKAGTPLADINKELTKNGQELAFEPLDYGPVLGKHAGKGTLGSVFAMNLAGPRRLKAGAARDHILGIQGVSGRGEGFKAGGKVVKNVTGYDIARGFCGSWGTLMVASEITMKVMPKAEQEATVCLAGLNGAEATQAMAKALGSSAEVSSAAFTPQGVTIGSGLDGGSAVFLRLEGVSKSVSYRIDKLKALLREFGAVEVLEGQTSKSVWESFQKVEPFSKTRSPLWRISVAPTRGEQVVRQLEESSACRCLRDWGGGLLWVEMGEEEPKAKEVREAVLQAGGGHATLVRAPAQLRSSTEVFQKQDAALFALTRRLKAQFDPIGILNFGRMYAGV